MISERDALSDIELAESVSTDHVDVRICDRPQGVVNQRASARVDRQPTVARERRHAEPARPDTCVEGNRHAIGEAQVILAYFGDAGSVTYGNSEPVKRASEIPSGGT